MQQWSEQSMLVEFLGVTKRFGGTTAKFWRCSAKMAQASQH
jgi:hypothetical protein